VLLAASTPGEVATPIITIMPVGKVIADAAGSVSQGSAATSVGFLLPSVTSGTVESSPFDSSQTTKIPSMVYPIIILSIIMIGVCVIYFIHTRHRTMRRSINRPIIDSNIDCEKTARNLNFGKADSGIGYDKKRSEESCLRKWVNGPQVMSEVKKPKGSKVGRPGIRVPPVELNAAPPGSELPVPGKQMAAELVGSEFEEAKVVEVSPGKPLKVAEKSKSANRNGSKVPKRAKAFTSRELPLPPLPEDDEPELGNVVTISAVSKKSEGKARGTSRK